jgi:hypothetical protein
VSAALLVALYLGRLIILDADNPLLLLFAAAEGFVVNPWWYILLGLTLRRLSTPERTAQGTIPPPARTNR